MKRFALILVLLTAGFGSIVAEAMQTVKYTVTSKTTVETEGDAPAGVEATFVQTGAGKNGQMTAGNSTLFTLEGLQNLCLYSITLEMRSNKSAGAGWMEMRVGDRLLAEMPDAPFSIWWSEFTNEFVPLTWDYESGYTFLPTSAGGDGTTLDIYIEASQNSLYINSYTFTFAVPDATAQTVHFRTGTEEQIPSITESQVGAGIVLPTCTDADSIWHFCGWTAIPVYQETDKEGLPSIYAAGERFYPTNETTLYALYTDQVQTTTQWVQDTAFQSGDYILSHAVWKVMANSGINADDRLYTTPLPLQVKNADSLYVFPWVDYPASAVYHIQFHPDSTALIQHVQTNSYVGAPTKHKGALSIQPNPWHYRITPQYEVLFYQPFGADWMQLSARSGNSLAEADSIWYRAYNTTYTKRGHVLFNTADYVAPSQDEEQYTSFPFGTSLADVLSTTVVITPTGVENPQRERMYLYTLVGTPILQTTHDICFEGLPAGIYLLQVNNQVKKIRIH